MKGYLLRLTAAAILAALFRQAAPKGSSGRAARMGAGLLVLAAALSPLGEMDTFSAARDLVESGLTEPLDTAFLEKSNRELLSSLISSEAETYILDKARSMDFYPEVSVSTSVRKDYPVPWKVEIRGSPTEAQHLAMVKIITEDLDIPEERQEWLDM